MPRVAGAQTDEDRTTARALADDAQHALDAKDYARAVDLFQRARSLVHAPTLELGLARALAGAGQLVQAHETYQRIVMEGAGGTAPPAFKKAVDDARREQELLRPRLSFVVVAISGAPGAQVSLDGAPMPAAALGVRRAINPGRHVARATAAGHAAAVRAFDVAEGTELEVVLTPPVEAPRPVDASPSWTRRVAWGGVGAGAAALAFGGIAGGVALSRQSDLASRCPNGACPSDALAAVQGYQDLGALGWSGLVAASLLGGAGVALVVLTPRAHDERPLPPALVGAGASAAALGGVAGIMALGVKSDLDKACGAGPCPASEHDRVASYRTLGTAAALGIGLGAASAGAGVALELFRAPSFASATPIVGAGSIGVRGGF